MSEREKVSFLSTKKIPKRVNIDFGEAKPAPKIRQVLVVECDSLDQIWEAEECLFDCLLNVMDNKCAENVGVKGGIQFHRITDDYDELVGAVAAAKLSEKMWCYAEDPIRSGIKESEDDPVCDGCSDADTCNVAKLRFRIIDLKKEVAAAEARAQAAEKQNSELRRIHLSTEWHELEGRLAAAETQRKAALLLLNKPFSFGGVLIFDSKPFLDWVEEIKAALGGGEAKKGGWYSYPLYCPKNGLLCTRENCPTKDEKCDYTSHCTAEGKQDKSPKRVPEGGEANKP